MQGTEIFVYLDIVLYVSSLREHEKKKFQKLINKLREANLQPEKCEFL